jgi:hypothetical protein
MEEEDKYDNYDSDEYSDFDSNIDHLNIDEVKTLPFKSKNEFTKLDFEVINLCGKGAYAKVVQAKCLKDGKMKALKIVDKIFILKVIIANLGKKIISSLFRKSSFAKS